MYVAQMSTRFSEFHALYKAQAEATISNNIKAIKDLHAEDFYCVPLDGRKSSASAWEKSVQRDMDIHKYHTVVYEIEKITEEDQHITVFSTRRCTGVNDSGSRFNTEVRMRDDFIVGEGNKPLMTRSETISRDLWLGGVRLTLEQMPGALVLEQGCSDQGNGGFD